MSREAMQMALDMLNEIADDVYCDQKLEGVIAVLRQALETEREWVELTDEEIITHFQTNVDIGSLLSFVDGARYAEAKLKEKRNG
jgi:hypothetical protein